MGKIENKIETCIKSASNYSSFREWKTGDAIAYELAKRNGWLEKSSKHFKKLKKK
jgi:hypothetical protein